MSVFISHSHEDEAAYTSLQAALRGARVAQWDPSTLYAGKSLAEQLRLAIDQCHVCVFLATPRSLKSQWCHAELGAFWGAAKNVIVYHADPEVKEAQLPKQFRGNLWTSNAKKLLTAIKRALTEAERLGKHRIQGHSALIRYLNAYCDANSYSRPERFAASLRGSDERETLNRAARYATMLLTGMNLLEPNADGSEYRATDHAHKLILDKAFRAANATAFHNSLKVGGLTKRSGRPRPRRGSGEHARARRGRGG